MLLTVNEGVVIINRLGCRGRNCVAVENWPSRRLDIISLRKNENIHDKLIKNILLVRLYLYYTCDELPLFFVQATNFIVLKLN